jgi:hypothetical protein
MRNMHDTGGGDIPILVTAWEEHTMSAAMDYWAELSKGEWSEAERNRKCNKPSGSLFQIVFLTNREYQFPNAQIANAEGDCHVLDKRTCLCAPSLLILLSAMSPLSLSSFLSKPALVHVLSLRIRPMYLLPRSRNPGPSRVAHPNARIPTAGTSGSSCVAPSVPARQWYERAHGPPRGPLAISGAARCCIVLERER